MNKKRKNVRNWIILLLVVLLGIEGAAIVGRDVGQPQPVLTQALAETTENGSEVFTMVSWMPVKRKNCWICLQGSQILLGKLSVAALISVVRCFA